ncbi:hypothetical protein R6Q59_033876 [Mikania micrantha]
MRLRSVATMRLRLGSYKMMFVFGGFHPNPPSSPPATTGCGHPATTTITRPNKQSQGFYGSLSVVSVTPPPPSPFTVVVVSSPMVSTPNQWYDFLEQLATGLRRHRSTSSYPDLREQTPQWNQPVTGLNLSQPPFSH